jgi:hypothetical protein
MSQRIELHAATDRWMMGDRYGTIVRSFLLKGERRYRVKLDVSGKTVTLNDDLVGRWL